MVVQASKGGVCRRIGLWITNLFKATRSFIIFYLALIVFCVPLILILLWRSFVSIIFCLFYKGRYELVPPFNGTVASNKYPDSVNITFFLFIEDFCDVKRLQKRILANISTSDITGNVPYKLFFNALVTKFGFYCFENVRMSFNIQQHVRICPGVENPEKIHTESEMFSLMAPIASQEWTCTKPRWEIVVIPKMKKEDTNQICSVIGISISHAYVDGISFAQFLRNCVVDKPSPKLSFDPVNPPIPHVPFIMKVALYIKLFFVFPHNILKNGGISKEQVMYDENLYGSKMIGRTKLELSLKTMKLIRQTFNCCTQAVFHTAFTSALKTVCRRRECKIPDEIFGGVTLALLPYPNEYPQDRGFLAGTLMPIGIEDKVERLSKINENIQGLTKVEGVLTSSVFTRILGSLPACMIQAIFTSGFKLAYYVSNVPGVVDPATVKGKELALVFGVPPLVNGFRAGVGVSCHDGNFYAGVFVEKSNLIKNRADLDELIEEFENELKYFISISSV